MTASSAQTAPISQQKGALITGVTGQDGAYLAHLLLQKGYRVYGAVRTLRAPREYSNLEALGIADSVQFFEIDPDDVKTTRNVLKQCSPDEIYHLAAQSSVGVALSEPLQTVRSTALASANLLETWRQEAPDARFFMASSSEIFGETARAPQNEETPFAPRNPYGAAKLFAHALTVSYRKCYGLHANCGILFNHESPLRGEHFVTRKVTRSVARIKLGLQNELQLGDLEVVRDWGFAGDYVEAMWRMLQQETPHDYVLATGKAHSLRYFVEQAFAAVDLNWHDYVRIDESLLRRAETAAVIGDASLASARLGWQPRLKFSGLLRLMVQADMIREHNLLTGETKKIDYFGGKEIE